MAFDPNMDRPQPGDLAKSADYRIVLDNVLDLDTRVTTNSGAISGHESRISGLENETIPKCVLRKNTNQTIFNQVDSSASGDDSAADQVITWQLAEVDTAGMWSGDTIVIPEDGAYLVAGLINLDPIPENDTDPETPGEAILYITLNDGFVGDTAIAAFGQPGKIGGGLGNGLSTSVARYFVAGDVLRVWVYQSSSVDRIARAAIFGGCTFAVTKQV